MKKPPLKDITEYIQPVPAPLPGEHITIPVAEYIYLHRVDALMDALLVADNFNNAQVIASIKNAVQAMRNPGEGGAVK